MIYYLEAISENREGVQGCFTLVFLISECLSDDFGVIAVINS